MRLDVLAVLCCDVFAVGPRLLERGPACLAEQRLPRGPVAGLPEGFNVGCVTQVGQHGRQFPGFPQPQQRLVSHAWMPGSRATMGRGGPCSDTSSQSGASRAGPPGTSLSGSACRCWHWARRSDEHTSELQSLMPISYAV